MKQILFFLMVCVLLFACAGSKSKAQELVLTCDILFEYQSIENDSISLLVGNTLRLHTGKANESGFFPLMISIRSPQDLDRPTSTEVIADSQELLTLLKQRIPTLQTVGVIVGASARLDPNFQESNAIAMIQSIVNQIPESKLLVFQEQGGEIVSVR
jgi:hypothetical protein